MNPTNSEVGLCISGRSAIVAGPKNLVDTFLEQLNVDSKSAARVGQSAADATALVSGIAAVTSSLDGRWFQMTTESHARFAELSKFNASGNGLVSGVLRTDKGKIDSFLNFQRNSGLNPMAMSNVATLTATLALRSAVAQVEQLVQEMDVKLDRLLQDNRARALGNLQGMTQVLTRTYEIYEETGTVSDTAWDQIAGHATALAQATSHCVRHIDSMTSSLKSKSFGDRADTVQHIADGELGLWLAILATSHANQKRLETLELSRLAREDDATVEVHLAANGKAAELQESLVANQLGALLEALQSTADISDFNRVRSPQKSRQMLGAVEESVELISRFGEIYGLEDLQLAHTERESWRKSVADLARAAGGSIAATAKGVPSNAIKLQSVAQARGRSIIQAKRSKRTTRSISPLGNKDNELDGDESQV